LDRKDQQFMRKALRLARKGIGRTSPNPAVGAVIVRNGTIIASGYHRRAGDDHAEIEALKELGMRARNTDVLYVTLEPCNHHGRTPPCTAAILHSGIKKVVVGMRDPNPGVAGGGCEFLAAKGIDVKVGVLESECIRLNEWFIKYVTTGRPYVVVKSAMTLDGWTATSRGHSRWITNEKSRQFVHRLRDRMDAVLVGVGTVLADDPSLTTRLKGRRGRDPIRVIVDTHLRTSPTAKVLNVSSPAQTILAVGEGIDPGRLEYIRREGVTVIACVKKDNRIDLAAFLDILGKMSVTSLLVEGGAAIIGSLMREGLVDKFYILHAPKLLGGNDGIPMASGPGPQKMDECLTLKNIKVRRFGDDLLIRGYP
jgi:diaminohydroxyphosphoribosylaminopyrimidine deaminase/5-amino-6-(5-phosphoribosylamino)uracil reductase